MIDPKQGPLFPPSLNAELATPSRRHPAKRASADTASETERAGERPFAPKRQFSVVGS
jgi:hypothetical protein